MSKDRRKKLASLSFSEKIKLLEKLHERSLAFAASRKKLAEQIKRRKVDRMVHLNSTFTDSYH